MRWYDGCAIVWPKLIPKTPILSRYAGTVSTWIIRAELNILDIGNNNMPRKSRRKDYCDPKDCVVCQNILTDNAQMRCDFHSTSIFDNPIKKVKQENRRARAKNLQADLTFHEWATALEFFNCNLPNGMIAWGCAYCGRYVGDYLGIDHWQPIIAGYGTTVNNCVPCCWVCNVAKNVLDGDTFLGYLIDAFKSPIAEKQYKRVQKYFELLRQGISVRKYMHQENLILDYLEHNRDMSPFTPENTSADLLRKIEILRELRERDKYPWEQVEAQDYVEIADLISDKPSWIARNDTEVT
jgi:hypothetical protein